MKPKNSYLLPWILGNLTVLLTFILGIFTILAHPATAIPPLAHPNPTGDPPSAHSSPTDPSPSAHPKPTLEDYICGVVAAEMPASFEPQALAAQGIAARTYAVWKLQTTSHLCTDPTCCQAYTTFEEMETKWGEKAPEYWGKIQKAVLSTENEILTYQGGPIQAVFHASSFEKTAPALEVWGNEIPYLTAVSSPETAETVTNLEQTQIFTKDEFCAIFLKKHPDAQFDDQTPWITDIQYSDSGHVSTLKVGKIPVSGAEIRQIYNLRSTNFTVAVTDTQSVKFVTKGYGHGVGMSQNGANLLAKAGKTHQEILAHYYPGTTIQKVQDLNIKIPE